LFIFARIFEGNLPEKESNKNKKQKKKRGWGVKAKQACGVV
jgi:hypothetical protein